MNKDPKRPDIPGFTGALPDVGADEAEVTANQLPFDAEEIPSVESALLRYRIMAYVVGVLLIVLAPIGMPLKYIWDNDAIVVWVGPFHGWLYMILLILVFDLGRRVGWSIKWFILIALAGTIPFLSFVAEYYARHDVRARIQVVQDAA